MIFAELPAAVGEPVYVVSGQKRRVYTNWIEEYTIRGMSPAKNRVKLMFKDKDGYPRYSWWDMTAFGKTLFVDQEEAYKRMEELWG